MPSSLRFVLALLALAAVSGGTAVVVVYRQDDAAARIDAEALAGGHVDAGKSAIVRYGCGGCHAIEGVRSARGQVGPALDGLATHSEVAGRLSNQPDALIRWIRFPQQVAPGNGMPDLGVGEQDARDIAAYLYTLRPSP